MSGAITHLFPINPLLPEGHKSQAKFPLTCHGRSPRKHSLSQKGMTIICQMILPAPSCQLGAPPHRDHRGGDSLWSSECPQLESAAPEKVTHDGGTGCPQRWTLRFPKQGRTSEWELWFPLVGAGKPPQAELSSGSGPGAKATTELLPTPPGLS